MRVLVTGGSGLLGRRVVAMAKDHEILATYYKNRGEADFLLVPLDISESEQVEALINNFKPDAVIHTAAVTNVDYCEDHREDAREVNEEGTRSLAKACQKTGAKMIYVSSDFVFDGERGMYSEEDEVNPINYYGLTKLLGEKAVTKFPDYAIARVSVLYGWNVQKRLNYVTWVIDALKRGEMINIVTDQYASPTFVDNAAEAILGILEKDKTGIFHTAGGERISRYDFAKKIAKVFDLDESLIREITSEQLKQKAIRPKDSSLNIDKIERELGIKMLTVEEGLKIMKVSQ